MKKALILMTSLITLGFLAGCQSTSSNAASDAASQSTAPQNMAEKNLKTVSGTLAYRERIALPPTAVVKVTLEDISLADAPATVLSTQEFTTDGKQVPFAFELGYDNGQIKASHRYNVRASIYVDGKLRFTTDTIMPVITDEQSTHSLNLRLVGVR